MLDALIMIPEITKGMKSIGSKALLTIKKSITVLDHQIYSLKKIDKNIRITIATGFEANKIQEYLKDTPNINFVYNDQYRHTNEIASLLLYLNQHSPENLLIINNGILLKDNAVSMTNLSGESKVFLLDKPKENFHLGCSHGEKLEYIFYDLPELWAECLFLNRLTIDNIRKIVSPKLQQMYLFELLNSILSQDACIINKYYINKSKIMKINSMKDINKAKSFI